MKTPSAARLHLVTTHLSHLSPPQVKICDFGLMRAIGMTRRQTRSMIRLEAGIVALFGSLLGLLVGLFFGWIATTAIPDTIISRVDIPVITLAIYAVVATIAGLLAASLPARRAARLNVLDAIAAS